MKKLLQISTLFLSLTATVAASANDIFVSVTFDVHDNISDELVGGTMTAEVMNLTGGDIRNVNLRRDIAVEIVIPQEVLQFGMLANGDSGVVNQSFHATQATIDADKPTTWRLDFDEANGSHKQLVVTVD